MLTLNSSDVDNLNHPMFIYDNSGTGLLIPDLLTGIRINNIQPDALAALAKAAEIHVIEQDGQEIIRDYLALVIRVSDVNALQYNV